MPSLACLARSGCGGLVALVSFSIQATSHCFFSKKDEPDDLLDGCKTDDRRMMAHNGLVM
ncbi:uncharacterized protein BO96DRAFT_416840 [Aspergillus niger CBS 101883]|uniref:uncharacterized protein n=1 Tax=Aspergillus lacticoffeatus (strain CBS 101883) TaxID=1450533 RepID=UPI000D801145|nr:uncharacterized protein BO96DRAFT_416840 [Aspergillus niger CBS 101883]PYH50729.1 hypothetical protein BO96DRAFT_416840 [Aspergillus niger CBS 101883]